jgi:uncharacterized protein YkwD
MRWRTLSAPWLALALVALGAVSGFFSPGTGTVHAAGGCQLGDPALDSEEVALYTLINTYRERSGLTDLALSTNLERSAAWMAADMGARGYFGHTDSSGRDAGQRTGECGYSFGAGENIAAGGAWPTGEQVLDAWRASPPHNANLLYPGYVQIGIARAYVPGSPYGWYWVVDFGVGYDGTTGADFGVAESGVRSSDLQPGAWNLAAVLPGGLRVSDLEGWTAWQEQPDGLWAQYAPVDFVAGGTVIGLLPTGMSLDRGRNPR